MELLCPSCQRKLTILDQYAGQQMKCPMCTATFTAPALPPAPIPMAPVPVPPPPALDRVETPAPMPSSPPPHIEAPTPSGITGYTQKHTAYLSPQAIVYVAPVCILLCFFLFFFTWTGSYAGGYPLATQNGLQAAFGMVSPGSELTEAPYAHLGENPGFSILMVFYFLLLWPTLIVAAGVLVLQFVPFKLPPAAQQVMPYRWAIVGGLALLLLLLLVFQGTLGFGVEAQVRSDADKFYAAPIAAETGAAKRNIEVSRDLLKGSVLRTSFYYATWWLNLLAVVGAGTMYWMEQRRQAPLPRVTVEY